jgi:hypothetical protein
MSETETEIGWRIARGELPSPQRLPGFALFSLRFSGTGTAWREAHNEHVFRPPEQYLSAEMINRIPGVPVVTVHPEAGNLDSETYIQTAIGAICFGYVANSSGIQSDAGDELWCISRIGDDIAAAAMATGEFSTSPAVVFGPDSGNEKMRLQDGTSILLEGRPVIIDHLAACIDAGVWDKAGAAGPGIRTDSTKGTNMTDEEMAADKARKDAEGGNIDKVLKHLDSITKRMDDLEAKGPGDQPGKMADAAKARRDAEREAWARDDGAQCLQDDAEEKAEAGELEGRGIPAEIAADAARKARKDRMVARRDNSLSRRDKEIAESHEKAEAQGRADGVAQMFGQRAPMPMQGEKPLAYRKRLLRGFARHSTFKDANFDTIAADAATFKNVEDLVYADAVKASATPETAPGQRLARVRTGDGGHKITEWFGDSIFKQFSPPAHRATKWHIPEHRPH